MTEFVIEVNNLKRENDTILEQAIQDVLKKRLNVDISVDAVDIEDCGDTKSAIIYLQSIDEVKVVTDNINNNGFKFTQIAYPYRKISAKRVESKRLLKFYEVDQYLGDETRQREFKEGGGNIENFLRTGQKRCLASYACGIVNNREKGTVYIGVNDKGLVVGVQWNHDRRDRIKRRIAEIMMSDLQPPLTTMHYSVMFTPIRSKDGKYLEDVFVLEITFYTVDKFDKLYRANREVYQKADAVLFGPLGQSAIQEWEAQIRHKQIKEARNIELQEKIEKYEIDKVEKERVIGMFKQLNEEEKQLREQKELSFKRKKEEFDKEVSKLKEILEEKERSFRRKNDQLMAESEEKEKELKDIYNQMSEEEKRIRKRELSFKHKKEEFDIEVSRLKQIQEDKERSFKRKNDQLIAEREKERKLKDIYNQMREEEKILGEEKEMSFKRKKEEFEIEVSRLKQIHEENEKSFRRNTDQLIAEREEKERKLQDEYNKINEEEIILREEMELSFKKKKELFDEEVSRLKQIHEAKERSFRRNTDQLIAEREETGKKIVDEKRLREEKEKENYLLQREKSALVKENKTLIQKSKVCVIM
ncbi:trichohyalin-like isoform X2 [Mytilus californianus]|uniref:trichohyalin-like isoform X2 n=1 Tax=Mytilus californianus TaxID=6549 RepID=UPI002245CEAE|nr:trichohyalin-like isoform X2 [Mytilus californianus]